MITLSIKVEQRSLQDLRETLLSDTRGMVGAFKLALGEAVHYWRNNYLKHHFDEGAYSRYAGVATRARYSHMRPVDPNSVNGTQNRKWEVLFQQRTGLTQASLKMRSQFWKRMHMDNRPGIFSGTLRRQLLDGSFQARGTSKSMRGSWTGEVNWRAMSKPTYSQPSLNLGDTLVYANQEEIAELGNKIANDWFPVFASIANARSGMPALSDLPLLS